MQIKTKIKDLIKKSGPISLSRYMELCLWDNENGYYASNQVLGGNGDFITSPEISQAFGELIGLWALSFFRQFINKERLCITELGSGRGTLLKDAIRTICKVTANKIDLDITILERSERLITLQKENLKNKNVRWISDIKDLSSEPQIIIANEFFDALPINQYVKSNDGWYEKKVTTKNGKLCFTLDKKIWVPSDSVFSDFKIGDTIEYSEKTISIFSSICNHLIQWDGVLLVIDYGNISGIGDTLQAVNKHKFKSVLEKPGQSDLSSHVNFKLLKEIAITKNLYVSPVREQQNFLIKLGIKERLKSLTKNVKLAKAETVGSEVTRLIDPDKMGSLFKVIAITKTERHIEGLS
ncbi:SAM-dependent methyltransferase [Paracoccaceae bacterium]|nr:SAM-dependent methyltransferase [Paracoccaceae bacterium]